MRTFETGATRDTDVGKIDYEGFLSPFVLERFGQYMLGHQVQADGEIRASDNWQKGIPMDQYFKSFMRHTVEFWKAARGADMPTADYMEELACAIMFNIMGWLHESLKLDAPTEEAMSEEINDVGPGVDPLREAKLERAIGELATLSLSELNTVHGLIAQLPDDSYTARFHRAVDDLISAGTQAALPDPLESAKRAGDFPEMWAGWTLEDATSRLPKASNAMLDWEHSFIVACLNGGGIPGISMQELETYHMYIDSEGSKRALAGSQE